MAGNPHFQILYLFPITFCAGAGLLLTVAYRGRWAGEILRGTSVVLGYALAMLVGAVAFSMRESGFGISVRLGPSYVEPVVFGLVIAGLAGSAGGLLYRVTRRTR